MSAVAAATAGMIPAAGAAIAAVAMRPMQSPASCDGRTSGQANKSSGQGSDRAGDHCARDRSKRGIAHPFLGAACRWHCRHHRDSDERRYRSFTHAIPPLRTLIIVQPTFKNRATKVRNYDARAKSISAQHYLSEESYPTNSHERRKVAPSGHKSRTCGVILQMMSRAGGTSTSRCSENRGSIFWCVSGETFDAVSL